MFFRFVAEPKNLWFHISIRGVEDAAPYHRARQNIKFIMCNKTKLQQDDASIVPYR